MSQTLLFPIEPGAHMSQTESKEKDLIGAEAMSRSRHISYKEIQTIQKFIYSNLRSEASDSVNK